MSFRIIGTAFELPLVGNDKLVFLALCENADDTTRTCWPSYSTIQRKASLANSSLKTVLTVLEAIGLISIQIRSTKAGGRTSTLYKISEFDVNNFDVQNYRKISKDIRGIRNFRKNKDTQSPKIGSAEKHSNLRKSIQLEEPLQAPKIDVVLDTQPPKSGEEPLASSSQPLVLREEEEEGGEGEIISSIIIPSQLHGLTEEEVVGAIQELSRRKRPSDPSSYESRLLAQVESGDHRTCENVLKIVSELDQRSNREAPWVLKNRLKREGGEALQLKMEEFGFSNPSEMYSAVKEEIQDEF